MSLNFPRWFICAPLAVVIFLLTLVETKYTGDSTDIHKKFQ